MQEANLTQIFQQSLPFWQQLSAQQKELLCANTTSMHYTKGTNIHRADTECLGIFLIQRGQLRSYLLSEDGRDITLYRLFSGDVCILSASCVLEAITFDVFIDAEEDTEVLRIPAAVFQQLSTENIYVQCYAYQLATTRFSDVMWAMQQILFMRADKRLAIFLYNEMRKQNTTAIHMTHEQIARYMGSAREVVSRLLKYFASEGMVKLSRGTIHIIDQNKLQQLI